MKRYTVLIAVAMVWSSLSYAADSPFGPHERDSRLMLYVSVPVGRLASTNDPALGLRFDRGTLEGRNNWSAGHSSAEFFGEPVSLTSATLMDLRLSLGRQRAVRFNGIPLWRADESSSTSAAADHRDSKPTRPLWKRPAFWIVAGCVTGVVLTLNFIDVARDVVGVYTGPPPPSDLTE